jgi:hypothetical protein
MLITSITSQIRFLNSQLQGNNINSESAAMSLVGQVKFSGTSRLSHSPTLRVHVIHDAQPSLLFLSSIYFGRPSNVIGTTLVAYLVFIESSVEVLLIVMIIRSYPTRDFIGIKDPSTSSSRSSTIRSSTEATSHHRYHRR